MGPSTDPCGTPVVHSVKTDDELKSTEGVNSLTVDDVARQAVPESGTSSAKGSIANSHKPRSRKQYTTYECIPELAVTVPSARSTIVKKIKQFII